MATERDTQSKSSWWSMTHHATSNHILELQKEIKEEEEEIFADINSLINSRSNCLYSSQDDCDDYDDHQERGQEQQHQNIFLPERPLTAASTTTASSSSVMVVAPTTTTAATTTTTQAPITMLETINKHHTTTTTTNNNNSTTTTTNTTTKTINNNISHLRTSYSSRLDEQLFYSDDVSDEDEDPLPNRYQKSRSANKISSRRDFQGNPSVAGANSRQQQHQQYDDEEEASRDHFHIDSGPPPEEVDFMHQDPYLDENHHLNKHQINDDSNDVYDANGHNKFDNQNYEAFQAVIQHVTSNLPKPCVFFLEGNCRRSDCKYSHDLSNITCKYWIEGFCFKGEMCPFLHSYNPPLDPNCLDEEGLKLLGKKELNPTFAIESEADFPSLPLDAPASALNDSTKSSNNTDSLTGAIKDQILSSNPAVVFKTVKKKRKKG